MSAKSPRSLALSLALALCVPAFAQASWSTLGDVWSNAQATYRAQGRVKSHDPAYAILASGQTRTFTATVSPNTSYVIHADCGGPCADVDIFAYDANGNVFAKDVRIDRSATLRIDSNGVTELRYGVRLAASRTFLASAPEVLLAIITHFRIDFEGYGSTFESALCQKAVRPCGLRV